METTIRLDFTTINNKLEDMSTKERICWALDVFGQNAVLLSSMQKSASVLMHHFFVMEIDNPILFVDTGYHFRETLQIRDEFILRYRLNLITLYPEHTPVQQELLFGKKLHLYIDGQEECCRLRKTVPYVEYMRRNEKKLAMVGLRRSEGDQRARLEPLMQDPRIDGYSLHPLYDWSDEQIESYLKEHNVPVHPLHRKNYPSIGCECCTTPIKPGEDIRAGRWRHLREPGRKGPKYCNINFSDGSGI